MRRKLPQGIKTKAIVPGSFSRLELFYFQIISVNVKKVSKHIVFGTVSSLLTYELKILEFYEVLIELRQFPTLYYSIEIALRNDKIIPVLVCCKLNLKFCLIIQYPFLHMCSSIPFPIFLCV